MPLPIPIFSPSPDVADRVIDALGSPDETLRTIAETCGTTVEALTLWMARPEIAERIDNIESAVARRTRLVATNYLPSVIQTLNRILDAYIYEESHVLIKPGSLMGLEYRRRSRESARRAASLLLRLARFNPGPCHRLGRSCGHACAQPNTTSRLPAPSLEDLLAQIATLAPESLVLGGVAPGSKTTAWADQEHPDTGSPPSRPAGGTDSPDPGGTPPSHHRFPNGTTIAAPATTATAPTVGQNHGLEVGITNNDTISPPAASSSTDTAIRPAVNGSRPFDIAQLALADSS